MELLELDLTLCNREDHDLCRICRNVDELECSRGGHCAGLRHPIGPGHPDRPQQIGYYLDADDVTRTGYTFHFEGNDEFLFCEDCAYEIEHLADGEVSEPVASGQIDDLHWVIDIADDKFQAWIAAYGPDHGMTMEIEGGNFDTFTEALEASRGKAQELVDAEAANARREVEDDSLREQGRRKHPTDLAVQTSLTVEQLDHILTPGFGEEPPLTVRDYLVDNARMFVGDMVAQLLTSVQLPDG